MRQGFGLEEVFELLWALAKEGARVAAVRWTSAAPPAVKECAGPEAIEALVAKCAAPANSVTVDVTLALQLVVCFGLFLLLAGLCAGLSCRRKHAESRPLYSGPTTRSKWQTLLDQAAAQQSVPLR